MSVSGFQALGVPDDLVARLRRAGILEPTPIQAAVIPDALAGRDVTGRAPTGSGKTLAFGMPLVAEPGLGASPSTHGARARPDARARRADRQPIAPARRRPRRHDVVSRVRRRRLRPAAQGARRRRRARRRLPRPARGPDLDGRPGARRRPPGRRSTRPTAWPTWASSRPCGGSSNRRNARRQVLLFSATLDGAVGKLAGAVQRDPVRHEVGAAGPDMTRRPPRVLGASTAPTDHSGPPRSCASSARRWCSAGPGTAPIGSPSSSASSA